MQSETSKIRKFPRHQVIQRALVLINLGIDDLPFHIVDVSKGGLAYRYLGPPLTHSDTVKINLYHESELIIEGLPVKPVSDNCLSDNPVPLWRGSVCFEALNSEQKAQIESFISTYADQLPLKM